MTSLELLERLAALVPPPRRHQLRYHGTLAPHAKWRSQIVPARPTGATTAACADAADAVPERSVASRIAWAELLKRVFAEDVLAVRSLWRTHEDHRDRDGSGGGSEDPDVAGLAASRPAGCAGEGAGAARVRVRGVGWARSAGEPAPRGALGSPDQRRIASFLRPSRSPPRRRAPSLRPALTSSVNSTDNS